MKKEYISPKMDIVNFSCENLMADSSGTAAEEFADTINLNGIGINLFDDDWD